MVAAGSVVAFRPEALPRPIVEPTRPSARLRAAPATFEAIAREHGAAVQAFALRLAGTPDAAHDLGQDCMERALRRFDTFTPGTNARAWLFAILHNAFIDRCRRRSAHRRTEDVDAMDVPAPDPIEPPAWAAVTSDQLAAAVARLDEEFRAVYRLHVDGQSYQHIAAQLGIPVNTVGTRLSRARSKLRVLLESALSREGESP
jgi:RNA polymerase sigma-70 factor (ECF subfamily)